MKRAIGRNLPPLDSLTLFEVAANTQSFTECGTKLGLTQSAVSRRILDLEAFIGCSLFIRGGGGLELTPNGQTLLLNIREPIAAIERCVTQLQSLSAATPRLRLKVSASYCTLWLIPRLPRFLANHPQILLDVAAHVGEIDMRSDTFDAAIVATERAPAGSCGHELTRFSLFPFASPALAATHRTARTALKNAQSIFDLPLLHLQQSPNDWHDYANRCKLGVNRVSGGTQNSLLSMNFHAAIAGMGVALLPEFFTRDAIAAGQLVRLSDIGLPQRRGFFLVHRNEPHMAERTRALLDWLLREHAAA
jgi:LysR family transcriptional regulator, glycine cleavage system transcriptional activator